MKFFRKVLDVLFRRYDAAHRFRWNLVPTLMVLVMLAVSFLYPGLFGDSQVTKESHSNPISLVIQSGNTACLYDRECPSKSCNQGQCGSFFELNTWAERRDLLKLILKDPESISSERQDAVDLTLTKALAIHEEGLMDIRPKVLEAMSIHSDPSGSLKLWSEKSRQDDLETLLSWFRFHDLASNPLRLQAPTDSTQDVLLLFADAHSDVLVGLCREKRLRRAYPSFDARCAWKTCRSAPAEPAHEVIRTLSKFWDCNTP